MRKNNISPNAKQAFENFKEEIAAELGVDSVSDKKDIVRQIVEKAENRYTNLGRS